MSGRREYTPVDGVLAEAEEAIAGKTAGSIDWVTFVGSEEPTLHSALGWLIRGVKGMTGAPSPSSPTAPSCTVRKSATS